MTHSRRNFIKKASVLVAGSGIIINPLSSFGNIHVSNTMNKSGKMIISYKPYDLQLTHVFTLANSSRKTTPVVLVEIAYEGYIGYGEASLPPYLGETQASVIEFFKKVNLEQFSSPFDLEEILSYVDAIAENNTAAKASIDIALHDLVGKIMGQPWYKIWGLKKENTPSTSFTIGIDSEEVVRQKTKEAEQYNILKVKLGRDTDKEIIQAIRSVSNKPIIADANQGWKDKLEALDMLYWLKEQGVEMIEQPMSKHDLEGNAWLTERSPIPTFADEAFQRATDVLRLKGVYSGVNIKLMKCTGMREAREIITIARAASMKVMMGCMTETSCAISAATHLSPLVDWADLDGNLLIDNDCFEGSKLTKGKLTLSDRAGIGVIRK